MQTLSHFTRPIKRYSTQLWPVFALLFLLAINSPAISATPVIEGEMSRLTLGLHTRFIANNGQAYSQQQIIAKPSNIPWQQSSNESVSIGNIAMPHWIYVEFDTKDLHDHDWLITIGNPMLESATFHVYENNHLISKKTMGSRYPFYQRPIHQADPNLPIKLKNDSHYQLLFYVEPEGLVDFPITLQTTTALINRSSRNTLINSSYYGMFAIMAAYNFFLFLSTGSLAYLMYVGFISSLGLFQASIAGIAYQLLWPNTPEINHYVLSITTNTSTLFATLFTLTFLNINRDSGKVYGYFSILAILSIFGVIGSFFLPQHVTLTYAAILAMTAFPSFFFAGVASWRKGYQYARFFTIAWFLLCFFVAWVGMAALGVSTVPINNVWNTLKIVSAAEMVLLAFALASRINYLTQREKSTREENRVMGEFIAQVSHELRTPMNGILGMSELLQGMLKDKTERHYNDVIYQSGQSLLNVINDILDSATLDANKLKIEIHSFDLHEFALNTFCIIEAQTISKKITLTADIDDRLPRHIKGDHKRIGQVLNNFLSNAAKFTNKGSIHLNIFPKHGFIRFEVTDTGIGLSEAEQQELFKPFSQVGKTHNKQLSGTGLGLHICKRLSKLMNGAIGVNSSEGKGATFWLEIPLQAGSIASMKALGTQGSESSPITKPLSILVAEDNTVNQLVIKKILEKNQHTVTIEEDGLKTLDKLKKNYSDYDLILMDCEMPKMDGYTTSKKIRQHEKNNNLPRKPIIALTAHALDYHHELCLNSGMDDVLSKPVNERRILEALHKHCAQ